MHTCNMVNTCNALLSGKHVPPTLMEWNSWSNTSLQNAINMQTILKHKMYQHLDHIQPPINI